MSSAVVSEFSTKTIGQIVAEDYRTAEVFRSFNIDFCCGGNRSISQACASKRLDPEVIYVALQEKTVLQSDIGTDYLTWNPSFLVDYIINVHHNYVKASISILRELSIKVARVHGHDNPALIDVAEILNTVLDEMISHMQKEEKMLFPYIKSLDSAFQSGEQKPQAHFGNIAHPIAMMEHEHEFAGSGMARINELTQGYTPPQHACASYRVLFSKLLEFEQDLHKHVHLENNILFPKAKQMDAFFA